MTGGPRIPAYPALETFHTADAGYPRTQIHLFCSRLLEQDQHRPKITVVGADFSSLCSALMQQPQGPDLVKQSQEAHLKKPQAQTACRGHTALTASISAASAEA